MTRRSTVQLVLAAAAFAAALFVFAGTSAARPAVAATSCTNEWMGSGAGSWDDDTSWSAHRVPTASDDVCITTASNQIVYLSGAQVAHSLTIGGTGTDALDLIGACGL